MNKKIFSFLFVLTLLFSMGSAVVDSCDQLSYKSDSPYLSGKVWHCELTENQFTTDQINIQYSAEDFERLTGEKLEKDSATASFSTSNLENTASYDFQIKSSGSLGLPYRDIVKLDFIYKDFWYPSDSELNDWARRNCLDYDDDGTIEYFVQGFGYEFAHCVQRGKKLGTAANIQDASSQVSLDIKTEINGETFTKTISNTNIGEGTTTTFNDFALVRWKGNLRSGETLPSSSDQNVLAVHDNSFADGWRIVSENDYGVYTGYLTGGGLKSDLKSWASGEVDEETAENIAGNKAETAINPFVSSSSEFSNDNVNIRDSSLSSGSLSIKLEDVVSFPSFDVYFDGSGDLKVEVPTGELSNPSASDVEFVEGNNGFLSASVENIGDGEAGVSANVDCSNGFSYSGTSKNSVIPPGGRNSFTFEITGSSTSTDQKEIAGSCTVEFEETSTGQTVSTTADVTFIQQGECQPGERVEGEQDGKPAVYECNDAGLEYELLEVCETGEVVGSVNGRKACVEESQATEPGFFERIGDALTGGTGGDGLFPMFSNAVLALEVLISFVAGLTAFSFSIDNLVPRELNVYVFWSVGVGIGLLAGLATYLFVGSLVGKVLIAGGLVLYGYVSGLVPDIDLGR